MIDAISQATAGMLAQERRLASAAQDVANDDSSGYKPGGMAGQQGALGGSTTDMADAAVTQITSATTYTALARVVRTAEEMQRSLLDLVA